MGSGGKVRTENRWDVSGAGQSAPPISNISMGPVVQKKYLHSMSVLFSVRYKLNDIPTPTRQCFFHCSFA
jgi:hypothetical protein